MTKVILLTILLLALSLSIYSVNQMDIMTTMQGEFMGSMLGISMASLDFNGDGIKDLVVLATYWNPTGVYDSQNGYGKLYFYMGGANFDNIPEYTIEGTFKFNLHGRIYNAGDMNGDGKEDLAMATGHRVIPPGTNELYSLYIYYGREIPQSTPDYILNIANTLTDIFELDPLGDVNNDGYADLSLVTITPSKDNRTARIILGNGFQQVLFIGNGGLTNWGLTLTGIGDVNNDGADDFHLYYPTSFSSENHSRLTVYFGSNSFPECDSLVICENTNQFVKDEGCSIGDVNGDGISDFISDMGSTGHVWFGGSDLSTTWDVSLSPGWFALNGPGPAVVCGDLNGDGYNDVIGTQYNYGGHSGNACIWLGKAQFNGTVDYYFGSPYAGQQFGWAKATGDFNNDGLCDLAISAPRYEDGVPLTLGYVDVYSGNTGLRDTTVENDDSIVIPASKLWAIAVYPNPIQLGKVKINLNLTGDGYKKLTSAKVNICNTKGQIVYSSLITAGELKTGTWQSKQLKLSSGIYLVSIEDANKRLVTKKITITN